MPGKAIALTDKAFGEIVRVERTMHSGYRHRPWTPRCVKTLHSLYVCGDNKLSHSGDSTTSEGATRDSFHLLDQRCFERPLSNKVCVPNADIMLPQNPQSNHLSPVKGELESRKRGQLIGYTLSFHHLQAGLVVRFCEKVGLGDSHG